MLGGMQALLGNLEAIANADPMFRLAARSWTTELAASRNIGSAFAMASISPSRACIPPRIPRYRRFRFSK
jgi:hypothetical protein